MSSIQYEKITYWFDEWRIQCLVCSTILNSGSCACGCQKITKGRVDGNPLDRKDVSIWISKTGEQLPQKIIDKYFLIKDCDLPSKRSTI